MVIALCGRDHQYIDERTETGHAPPRRPADPDWRPPRRPAGGRHGLQGGEGTDAQLPPWSRRHHDHRWASHTDTDWRFGAGRRGPPWRVPRDHGPFRRSRDERLVAGVAGGVAKRFGIDPTIVRVVILVTSLSGYGIAAYVIAWLLIPADGETEPIAKRSLGDTRGIALALAFFPIIFVALLIGSALGAGWVGTFALPAFVGVAGLVLIWRNADPSEQAVLHRAVEPLLRLAQPQDRSGGTGRLAVRVLASVALMAAGLTALLEGHATRTFRPLLGLLLVIAAIVTVFGPWWLRVARELVVERQARARAEERAEVAARVHDSVLQTLALIQRKSDEPQYVVQLARAQERELRSWLFEGSSPGAPTGQDASFAAGVNRIQAEVEALHGVAVEVVVVGDCDLDEGLRSLLAAGREAANNAAKWSGAPTLSLFGEVEPKAVSLFVRDRGVGFDPGAVGEEHKGIAESIRGRMARHGGTVAVRSSPGAGTEVALTMSREPARRARGTARS
jgi:signal transduction histidine kinase